MECQNRENVPQHLYVGHGRFDFPVVMPFDSVHLDSGPPRIWLDFSGGSGDGCFEFRPVDVQKVTQSSWWSTDEPVLFDFRASIIATLPQAKRRLLTFVEFCLDWLSLLHGVTASTPTCKYVYDETEAIACRSGKETAYTMIPFGMPTFSTTVARNLQLQAVPFSGAMARTARWIRKAMLSPNVEDRFFLYFATCDSLSSDLGAGDSRDVKCPLCEGTYTIKTDGDHGAFKQILEELFPGDGKDLYKKMNRLRGKIAHGGKHPDILFDELNLYEPMIKAAALACVARTLGVPVDSFELPYTGTFDVSPILRASIADKDPATDWGSPITETMKRLQPMKQ